MSKRTLEIVLLVLVSLVPLANAKALELRGNDRDGFVFSAGIGHGWNTVHVAEMNGMARDPNHMSTVIGAVKFGWAWNDELVGFVGMSGWSRSLFQNVDPASATNLNGLVELYYYPQGGGFWLQGGAGVGSLDYFLNAADPSQVTVFKESGFAFTVGAGYEARISDRYGVGISYGYTRLNINNFGNFVGTNNGNQVVAVNLFVYGS